MVRCHEAGQICPDVWGTFAYWSKIPSSANRPGAVRSLGGFTRVLASRIFCEMLIGMNFLRLADPLLGVLYEDDDIIAIDKPYGFNAHTNDSKIEHSDFIQDGLIEIYQKQRGQKLHIIHRLDQTTTGVMIFGKSAGGAKKYADFFLHRLVKKTYWFVTKNVSVESEFLVDRSIVHKARELEAKTTFSLIKKESGFELWRALPHTGRNHQIRIHAREIKLSILGDEKYAGHRFPFLCLHNHRIEFPNGITIISRAPLYYDRPALLKDLDLAQLLFERDRRLRIFSPTEDESRCYRLVHESTGINGGLKLDLFGRHMVLRTSGSSKKVGVETVRDFAQIVGRSILIKNGDHSTWITPKPGAQSQPAAAPPAATQPAAPEPDVGPSMPVSWTVAEPGMQFELRTGGSNIGLDLGQRLLRRYLLENSRGKTVLNIFASSGTLAVAAARGNAMQVLVVEASKNFVEWAKKNFQLNDLPLGPAQFFCRDSIIFLEQAVKRLATFDIITCEIPSFIRREKGHFKIEDGLERLLENCFRCLSEGGQLIMTIMTNHLKIVDIKHQIEVAGRSAQKKIRIHSVLPAMDCEKPDEPPQLKAFIIDIL